MVKIAKISIEKLNKLDQRDLLDLCDATEATMLDSDGFTIGFRQWQPPLRSDLEAYFKGVMMIPNRCLIIARVDGTIAGSIQLLFAQQNTYSYFSVSVDNHFVVPWARSFGIAKQLLEFAENYAREKGFKIITLSVCANMEKAVNLYERTKYKRWGTLKKHAIIGQEFISGYFYCKDL
jgi:ribosomal protein S18 acetylase RimI-like enzyme